MIILARLLEPSDFGLVAMIMVIVGIATIFEIKLLR
jgi:O-antigen/teichoic acid export membrane protein